MAASGVDCFGCCELSWAFCLRSMTLYSNLDSSNVLRSQFAIPTGPVSLSLAFPATKFSQLVAVFP